MSLEVNWSRDPAHQRSVTLKCEKQTHFQYTSVSVQIETQHCERFGVWKCSLSVNSLKTKKWKWQWKNKQCFFCSTALQKVCMSLRTLVRSILPGRQRVQPDHHSGISSKQSAAVGLTSSTRRRAGCDHAATTAASKKGKSLSVFVSALVVDCWSTGSDKCVATSR